MKKSNYTEKATALVAKAVKFGGETPDTEAIKFTTAYAKLARTPDTCSKWIEALKGLGQSDAVIQPFVDKKTALEAAVAEAAVTAEPTPEAV